MLNAIALDMDVHIANIQYQKKIQKEGWANWFRFQHMFLICFVPISWSKILYLYSIYTYFWDCYPSSKWALKVRPATVTARPEKLRFSSMLGLLPRASPLMATEQYVYSIKQFHFLETLSTITIIPFSKLSYLTQNRHAYYTPITEAVSYHNLNWESW